MVNQPGTNSISMNRCAIWFAGVLGSNSTNIHPTTSG